jgi:FixJ family two-component response regulator
VQDPDRDHTQPRQIGESAWQEIGFALDLSPRELQVGRCIWHGQHNEEIGIALRLSARTVDGAVYATGMLWNDTLLPGQIQGALREALRIIKNPELLWKMIRLALLATGDYSSVVW